MTHPLVLRERAIKLRTEQKMTIDEIARRLGLSRTTVYAWVRDFPIPRASPRRFPQGLGTVAMQARFKRERDEAYALGLEEFGELVADPTFRDFVCMYIGEGYKRSRNTVSVSNSDPAVIALSQRWIRRLSRRPIEFSVQFHADQDVVELGRFWSSLLGVDPGQIKFFAKSNSGRLSGRRWRCRHGVMIVRSHDTLLRARLQAWMDLVQRDWT